MKMIFYKMLTKYAKLLACIFCTILLFGCSPQNDEGNRGNSNISVSGNEDLLLGSKELHHLQTLGLSGDGGAAWKVSLNYFASNDLDRERYWGEISAQDGDPVNQFGFATILSTFPDIFYQIRSIFWANSALIGLADGERKVAAEAFLVSEKKLVDQEVGAKNIKFISLFGLTEVDTRRLLDVKIDDKNLFAMQWYASLGDSGAAVALTRYYWSVEDFYGFFYWSQIAAENRDVGSELLLADRFRFSASADDLLRADFWANRVLANTADTKIIDQARNVIQSDSSK